MVPQKERREGGGGRKEAREGKTQTLLHGKISKKFEEIGRNSKKFIKEKPLLCLTSRILITLLGDKANDDKEKQLGLFEIAKILPEILFRKIHPGR